MHGNEPLGFKLLEDFDGLVWAHMDLAKGFGMIGADWQQSDLRTTSAAYFLEAVKISAVARMINSPALMLENKAAKAPVMVAQNTSAPMFTGRESDAPILVNKGFPPFEFDDALEAEVMSQVAHSPGHNTDFRMWEAPEGRFVKMIEVGMGEQDQVDRR